MSLVYIASPYAHEDPAVMDERARLVREYVAHLYLRETRNAPTVLYYSPISHFHNIKLEHDLPASYDFWLTVDTVTMNMARSMHVLMLPGWSKSKGIWIEVKHAWAVDLPVKFVMPSSIKGQYFDGSAEAIQEFSKLD